MPFCSVRVIVEASEENQRGFTLSTVLDWHDFGLLEYIRGQLLSDAMSGNTENRS